MVKRTAKEAVEVGGAAAETNRSEPPKKRFATEKTTETSVEEKVAVAEERDQPPQEAREGPEVIDISSLASTSQVEDEVKNNSDNNACSVPKQDDPSALSAQQVQFLLDELNRSKARLAATSMLLAQQTGIEATPTLMPGEVFPSPLTATHLLGVPPILPHMANPCLPPFGRPTMMAPPNAASYGLPPGAPVPLTMYPPGVSLPPAGLLPHQRLPMDPLLRAQHQRSLVAAGYDPQGANNMMRPPHLTADTKHLNFLKTKQKAAPKCNPTRIGFATKSTSKEGPAEGPVEEDGICVPLALPFDKHRLSSFQYLLRQQIDLFEATRDDIYGNSQGRNTPIVRGQVGIRCRHCYLNFNPEEGASRKKPRGSVYFPTKLNGLYQAAQNMAINHFFSKSCQFISPTVLNDLVKTKKNKTYHLGGGKSYWSTSAEVQNICEYDNRLWFSEKGSSVPRNRACLSSSISSTTMGPLLSAATGTRSESAPQQGVPVQERDCNAPSDSAGLLNVDTRDSQAAECREEEVATDHNEPSQTKSPPFEQQKDGELEV